MSPIRLFLSAGSLASAVLATGCGSDSPEEAAQPAASRPEAGENDRPIMATAMLRTSDGRDAGSVRATRRDDGILVEVSATGLAPGEHGIHVHATGRCDAPGFESAGGHWNPADAEHGLSNPQGQHHGDMPNLVAASDGTGRMDYMIREGRFAEMLDGDGAALVIHARADDQMTDPSGDSGERIACGVFTRG